MPGDLRRNTILLPTGSAHIQTRAYSNTGRSKGTYKQRYMYIPLYEVHDNRVLLTQSIDRDSILG